MAERFGGILKELRPGGDIYEALANHGAHTLFARLKSSLDPAGIMSPYARVLEAGL